MSERSWESCRAWVSGGTSGIGAAFATELARRGAEVHVTGRSGDAPDIPGVIAHAMDFDDASSVEACARAMKAAPPDLFVHAAHRFSDHVPIVGLAPADFRTSIAANVGGAFELLRAASRAMGRARFGRIVVVGSFASVAGGIGQVQYIAEKAALEGLVRAFATELRGRGVSVNIVQPGIVDTANLRARVTPAIREAYASRTLSGELVSEAEVVRASLPLLDPAGCGVTGQSLVITGGAELGLSGGAT